MDKSLSVAIVGNTNKKLMSFALEKTIQSLPKYDDIIVVSDEPIELSVPYKFYKINGPFGIPEYSEFIIKQLNSFIETDYCMTIQYDGFAVNKDRWREDFLNYDFIGTPVSPLHQPMNMSLNRCVSDIVDIDQVIKDAVWKTGGGGFNIKSKKFLEACANDAEILAYLPCKTEDDTIWICDDMTLNFVHDKKLKENYGINFADLSTCLNFGSEIATAYTFPFGFHGWYHVGLHLTPDEIVYYMENLSRNSLNEPSMETGLFLGFLWARKIDDLFNYYSKKFQMGKQRNSLHKVWPPNI